MWHCVHLKEAWCFHPQCQNGPRRWLFCPTCSLKCRTVIFFFYLFYSWSTKCTAVTSRTCMGFRKSLLEVTRCVSKSISLVWKLSEMCSCEVILFWRHLVLKGILMLLDSRVAPYVESVKLSSMKRPQKWFKTNYSMKCCNVCLSIHYLQLKGLKREVLCCSVIFKLFINISKYSVNHSQGSCMVPWKRV